jgi:hypothetical protein
MYLSSSVNANIYLRKRLKPSLSRTLGVIKASVLSKLCYIAVLKQKATEIPIKGDEL